jgi:hypothetical protein
LVHASLNAVADADECASEAGSVISSAKDQCSPKAASDSGAFSITYCTEDSTSLGIRDVVTDGIEETFNFDSGAFDSGAFDGEGIDDVNPDGSPSLRDTIAKDVAGAELLKWSQGFCLPKSLAEDEQTHNTLKAVKADDMQKASPSTSRETQRRYDAAEAKGVAKTNQNSLKGISNVTNDNQGWITFDGALNDILQRRPIKAQLTNSKKDRINQIVEEYNKMAGEITVPSECIAGGQFHPPRHKTTERAEDILLKLAEEDCRWAELDQGQKIRKDLPLSTHDTHSWRTLDGVLNDILQKRDHTSQDLVKKHRAMLQVNSDARPESCPVPSLPSQTSLDNYARVPEETRPHSARAGWFSHATGAPMNACRARTSPSSARSTPQPELHE